MMFNKQFPHDIEILFWLVVGIFSAWGGLVRYLMDKRSRRRRWCWSELFTQLTISCFTGFLGGFYSYEQHCSTLMTLSVAGLSGSLGASLLRWLWKRCFPVREEKS
jgi:fluoride ion exporter CrcB/FEX